MRRFAVVLLIGALAVLGYGACNRIVDLTPDASSNPDASPDNLDDASGLTPDTATPGPDGADAIPSDASIDAS